MKLKEIYWEKEADKATAYVMGLTLSVYQNNGKWDARLYAPNNRPETETGFVTSAEAMRYAEHTLLHRELKKYFKGVTDYQHSS